MPTLTLNKVPSTKNIRKFEMHIYKWPDYEKNMYVDLPLSLPLVVLITLRLSPLEASLINGCFS